MRVIRGIVVAGVAVVALAGTASTAFAATAQPASSRLAGGAPDGNGLGSTGDLVSGLAGGAGTLGFLLPSPNGSGASFVNGLMSNPAAAITGTPNSILPYGLLDGGKS